MPKLRHEFGSNVPRKYECVLRLFGKKTFLTDDGNVHPWSKKAYLKSALFEDAIYSFRNDTAEIEQSVSFCRSSNPDDSLSGFLYIGKQHRKRIAVRVHAPSKLNKSLTGIQSLFFLQSKKLADRGLCRMHSIKRGIYSD